MTQQGPQVRTPPPEQKPSSPKWLIGAGLFMYAAAVGLFFYFGHLEQTGGSASMHAAIAFLYNIGGKWLVAIVLAAFGTLALAAGIADLRKPKK